MFMSILTSLRQSYELRQTVNGLLARADDHLLSDIGMNRDDILRLVDAPRTANLGRSAILSSASAFA